MSNKSYSGEFANLFTFAEAVAELHPGSLDSTDVLWRFKPMLERTVTFIRSNEAFGSSVTYGEKAAVFLKRYESLSTAQIMLVDIVFSYTLSYISSNETILDDLMEAVDHYFRYPVDHDEIRSSIEEAACRVDDFADDLRVNERPGEAAVYYSASKTLRELGDEFEVYLIMEAT